MTDTENNATESNADAPRPEVPRPEPPPVRTVFISTPPLSMLEYIADLEQEYYLLLGIIAGLLTALVLVIAATRDRE